MKKHLESYASKYKQKSTIENERKMIEARKVRDHIYRQMMSKKKDLVEKAQKRAFNENEHDYAEDVSVRKKTKENNENSEDKIEEGIGRVPGQLYTRAQKCQNCRQKFNTFEAMTEHVKMKKNKFRRRQIPRATFTAKENLFILICKFPGCCYYGASLDQYDQHLVDAHEDSSRKKLVDIYMPYEDEDAVEKKTCEKCNKIFSRAYHLKRHRNICIGPKYMACDICGSSFKTSIDYIEHISNEHIPPSDFVELNSFKEAHDPSRNPSVVGSRLADDVMEARLAKARTYFRTYTKFNTVLTTLDETLSYDNLDSIVTKIKYEQRINGFIKFNLSISVILSKLDESGNKECRFSRVTNSKDYDVTIYTNFDQVVMDAFQNLFMVAENISEEGSGSYIFYGLGINHIKNR